jgi:hypothetical protein
MQSIHLQQVIEKDGEVVLKGLPFMKGQPVEITVQPQAEKRETLTVGKFRESGLIGMWKDRDDIGDSTEFSRKIRNEIETSRKIEL